MADAQFSTIAWGPNRLDVFGIGTGGDILHFYWAGSPPWQKESRGGQYVGIIGTSALVPYPGVLSQGPGQLDVFCINMNTSQGEMTHLWWPVNGPSWNQEVFQLPTSVVEPSIVSWGSDQFHSCFINANAGNAMFHAWFTGRQFAGSQWQTENIGGVWTSGPSLTSWGPQRLDVFGVGTDMGIYHKWWPGDGIGGGKGWQPAGADTEGIGSPDGKPLQGGPKVVSWAPGRLDVFVLASDDRIYHKAWEIAWVTPTNPTGWQSQWEVLGDKQFQSSPTIVSWGPGRLDVF
jgi:hypothetical protein